MTSNLRTVEPPVIRVAIDPRVAGEYGPEVHWVLRLWLTTAGWAWREVALGDPADIVYSADLAQDHPARLVIQARPDRWARRKALTLTQARGRPDLPDLVYAGEPEAGSAVAQDGRLICPQDLVFDTFFVATGQMESRMPQDKHGFHDLGAFPEYRQAVLDEGLVSAIAAWVEKTLLNLGCPPPQPRWPDGRRAALALGHDVDYPEVIRWLEPARVLLRQGPRGLPLAAQVMLGQRHHWHFPEWMKVEQALGARSAFYFVARQGSLVEYATGTPDSFYDVGARPFQRLFQTLREAGFEVGLHASYRAYASREQFEAEKARLEAVSGGPVVGNRHHYWHMDPADPEATLKLHEAIGLHYDSSVNHNRYLGWRRGVAHPYFPFLQTDRREIRTLQVPVTWMDDQLFSMRVDNPGDPWARLQAMLDRAVALGGCFVVDIHDYVFDAALFPGWSDLYRRLVGEVGRRGDFWLATPAEVAAHWRARHAQLLSQSAGLGLGLALPHPSPA